MSRDTVPQPQVEDDFQQHSENRVPLNHDSWLARNKVAGSSVPWAPVGLYHELKRSLVVQKSCKQVVGAHLRGQP